MEVLTDLKDVALHYSSMAFRVRMSALTFVGAAIAASLEFFKDPRQANVVGTALILISGSLSSLNHRYTHSYICACYAAGSLHPTARPEEAPPFDRWRAFSVTNERPYQKPLMRFLLSWLTYWPGILAGCYFVLREGPRAVTFAGWIGLLLAGVTITAWGIAAIKRPSLSVNLAEGRGQWVE
jgi:hypothetical protein